MKRTLFSLLGLVLLSYYQPILAQTNDYPEWGEIDNYIPELTFYEMDDESPEGSKGYILYFNGLTYDHADNEFLEVDTPLGTFVFQMDMTYNNECGNGLCPDTATLFDAPDGWTVSPYTLTVGELQAERFVIFPILSF